VRLAGVSTGAFSASAGAKHAKICLLVMLHTHLQKIVPDTLVFLHFFSILTVVKTLLKKIDKRNSKNGVFLKRGFSNKTVFFVFDGLKRNPARFRKYFYGLKGWR
jgi:hypothetical protein